MFTGKAKTDLNFKILNKLLCQAAAVISSAEFLQNETAKFL